MDKKTIAKEYISVTRCDLMEDGYWKAVNEVHDRVLYENEDNWIDEKVDAMAMDVDPQNAIKTSMESVLRYIIENVYNNGFKSLVEYREFQRALEEKKAEAKLGIETSSN